MANLKIGLGAEERKWELLEVAYFSKKKLTSTFGLLKTARVLRSFKLGLNQ